MIQENTRLISDPDGSGYLLFFDMDEILDYPGGKRLAERIQQDLDAHPGKTINDVLSAALNKRYGRKRRACASGAGRVIAKGEPGRPARVKWATEELRHMARVVQVREAGRRWRAKQKVLRSEQEFKRVEKSSIKL